MCSKKDWFSKCEVHQAICAIELVIIQYGWLFVMTALNKLNVDIQHDYIVCKDPQQIALLDILQQVAIRFVNDMLVMLSRAIGFFKKLTAVKLFWFCKMTISLYYYFVLLQVVHEANLSLQLISTKDSCFYSAITEPVSFPLKYDCILQ